MNHPTGRVLTLLELLQSGGTRTTAELAERLGMDGRTVRRYVQHLLDLDVPVESVRGRYGGYRLAPAYRLPPLMLSDDEALAVLLGLLGSGRSGLTTAMDTAAETATAKIRRVLPVRLGRRLEDLLAALSFTGEPGRRPPVDAAVLLTLADAVRHGRPVAIGYTDRHGARGERTLQPYGIVSHAGHWYVTGRDTGAEDERTFRLDRIAAARTLPGRFERPPGFDPARHVLSGFATAAYRYAVTVWIEGTVEQIRTRLPASLALVDERDADANSDPAGRGAAWRRVEMRVEQLDWLPPLLAALDLPFEIERPDELRDVVLALADRLARSARRPAGRTDRTIPPTG